MARARGATVLALLLAAGAHAADLGTLFYTPAERERLDRERSGEATQATGPESRGPHSITGYVERSDGRGVVWIDGRPVVVQGPGARRVFDPAAVSAYARSAEEVKLQTKR